MKNTDIRNEASRAGVKLWQIAEAMGMADCNFSRRLRKELSDSEKNEIRQIIKNLKEGKGHE
ncbi:hypothetical protein LJC56_10680 [Christensenellaceae bacterium OttesenSCG-928-K19]|nr:hypothetical protein [Christensenellaceae bacterium OttesenSCG-928-K19]